MEMSQGSAGSPIRSHRGHTPARASEGQNDVALISSKDLGRTIEIERPAAGVQQDKKWLANLERATGHHQVNGRPGVIFTAGTRGKGNTDILSNDVFWA